MTKKKMMEVKSKTTPNDDDSKENEDGEGEIDDNYKLRRQQRIWRKCSDEDDQGEEDIFDEEDESLREGLREGGKLSEWVGNEHLGNLLSSWLGVA